MDDIDVVVLLPHLPLPLTTSSAMFKRKHLQVHRSPVLDSIVSWSVYWCRIKPVSSAMVATVLDVCGVGRLSTACLLNGRTRCSTSLTSS